MASTPSASGGYWIPAYLAAMKAYIDNPNVKGMYGMWDAPDPGDVNGPFGAGVPGEGGVDLGAPRGTPVYALADGPIIGIGYWRDMGHGVVTTRVNVPGYGANDIYYQHIIFDNALKEGTIVRRGQQIGTVGQYNETEIGFNANWGQPWGLNHPAGWVKDPRPLIKNLMAQGQPAGTPPGMPPGTPGSTPTATLADNPMARLANTVLLEVGVPSTAVDAINAANGGAMTYIGAGITGAVLAAAAGLLFLFTGV